MINKKNMLGVIAVVFMVLISAVPTFAAQSSTQQVTVTVNPTVAISAAWNAGGNNSSISLASDADNIQKTYSGEVVTDASNVNIDIYTRATNFVGPDTFALNNFMYSGGSVSSATVFTNNYAKICNNLTKPAATTTTPVPVTLYLTVPYGTGAGSYTNTVYFAAVQNGTAAPNTP